MGRNGGPPSSTHRTLASQAKTVPSSPAKSPSYLGSASPVAGVSVGQSWRERDSGLSGQSIAAAHESRDGQDEDLDKLLEECRAALGVTASPDRPTNTKGKLYFTF